MKAAGDLAAAVLDAADSKVDLLQIDTGARTRRGLCGPLTKF